MTKDNNRMDEPMRAVALPLLRFSAFAGMALVFGLVPVTWLVLRPAFAGLDDGWSTGRRRVARRLEGLALAGLAAAGTATAILLVLQAALVADLGSGTVGSDSFAAVFDTSFGQWYGLRFPLIAGLAVVLTGRVAEWSLSIPGGSRGPGLIWWGTWTGLGITLLATSSFSGHAAVASPTPLALANDIVHLAAGATWFTGVISLAIALPDGWKDRGASQSLRLLAPAVMRFARVALVSVTIVALTGLANSFLHVKSFGDLIDSSYGRVLVLKLILFAVILALGALNHWFSARRLERALIHGSEKPPLRIFRRAIAAEVVAGLLIMGMTGVLVGLPRTRTAVRTHTPPPISVVP
jgi:putative copper export protein